MVVRPANGLIGWTLRRTGFAGVTLPWGIYILPERLQDARLVRHEQAHADQIAQYGVIGFYAKYLWFTLRYGYRNNPLEEKARKAEDK
jgi:hypothetical protein